MPSKNVKSHYYIQHPLLNSLMILIIAFSTLGFMIILEETYGFIRNHNNEKPNSIAQGSIPPATSSNTEHQEAKGKFDELAVLEVPRFKELIIHPKKTKFVHPSLHQKHFGPFKHYGVVAKKAIPKYTIIAVDYPLFTLETPVADMQVWDLMTFIGGVVRLAAEKDADFFEIWSKEITMHAAVAHRFIMHLEMNDKAYETQELVDMTRFVTNWYGHVGIAETKPNAIYTVLSKINFGLPQNTVALFGDADDNYVCTLMTTKDIEAGEELFMDYYLDWHKKESLFASALQGRQIRGKDFGFALDGKWIKLQMELISKSVSAKRKREIMLAHFYSNGFIVKEPGKKLQVVKTDKDALKKAVIDAIESGEIFNMIRGDNINGNELYHYFLQRAKDS